MPSPLERRQCFRSHARRIDYVTPFFERWLTPALTTQLRIGRVTPGCDLRSRNKLIRVGSDLRLQELASIWVRARVDCRSCCIWPTRGKRLRPEMLRLRSPRSTP